MSQQHRLNTQLRPYIQPTANAQMYKCPADLIDWPPSILHFVPASREDYQDVYISQTNSYHLFLHHSDVKSPLLWTKQLAGLTILVLGSPKSRTHTPSVKEQNSVKLSIQFVLGELWFSPEFHLPELVPHNPKSTQYIQHLSLHTWPLI
jgi:hypothetical protein